jgi:hypothetical protein
MYDSVTETESVFVNSYNNIRGLVRSLTLGSNGCIWNRNCHWIIICLQSYFLHNSLHVACFHCPCCFLHLCAAGIVLDSMPEEIQRLDRFKIHLVWKDLARDCVHYLRVGCTLLFPCWWLLQLPVESWIQQSQMRYWKDVV